jgi:hypothetical protein
MLMKKPLFPRFSAYHTLRHRVNHPESTTTFFSAPFHVFVDRKLSLHDVPRSSESGCVARLSYPYTEFPLFDRPSWKRPSQALLRERLEQTRQARKSKWTVCLGVPKPAQTFLMKQEANPYIGIEAC